MIFTWRRSAFLLLSLPLLGLAFQQQPDAPSSLEQEHLVSLMRDYAGQYVSGLPNFLCLQVTKQFEAGAKSDKFHKGDVLVSRLSFNQGREQRGLESVNGKSIESGVRRGHSPLTTEGEFGTLLNQVLGKGSAATFTWDRWESVRGKRLAVFDFEVDRQHSTLSLQLSDLARATLPYHGDVYADPETGAIWRITNTVFAIPVELKTRQFSTTVDYSEIAIGDKKYLLPLEAEVNAFFNDKKVRNHMEFQSYRKFEAETVVTFGTDK